ncbi:MAG: short-subunit dehydrogenase [Motiliproteus sp.]|jgi:short-subunit dehydrogenase
MHSTRPPQKIILITGASGAIGGALALEYAADATLLILHGRNRQRLETLAARCQQRGARTRCDSFDLRDTGQLQAWAAELCSSTPPDLLIANAGININSGANHSGERWKEMEALLDLNIKATLALVSTVADTMRRRGAGQIAIISSLAAYYGLPVTPSYSASKAAVKAYGEGLRGWLAPDNVGVTVVMPGYVASPMSQAMPGPKPLLWSPERAARVIRKGLDHNRARISFPFPLNFGSWWLAVLPSALSQRILKLLNYAA